MKKYKYLLFDWDGCLGKTLQIVLDAYKDTFAEYELYPSDRTITQDIFGDWDTPKKLGITNLDQYNKKYIARIKKNYPAIVLYSGVSETLNKLKREDKKLALISTAMKSYFVPVVQSRGIFSLFDVIFGKEDVTHHKPDPEIIYKAIAALGGNKEEAIIIGDSINDLGAAKNAGIDSILFSPRRMKSFTI